MSKKVEVLGCIDPHGMWPFPASRDVCPKCQAIRRSHRRRGLPYGWWKSADLWAAIILGIVFVALILAWFLDLKPSDLPWN